MLRLRKIVFYIFYIVYLILCPLIVARMLGFVINPITHRLVKTGLVFVSTIPPQATVYVDGRMAHQETPTAIRDLQPGEHFIRVELDGYKDWEKTVSIIGNKATALSGLLLIPEEWPITVLSRRSYQNIFPAGGDMLVATNPLLKNIDIFHTTQGLEDNFKKINTYEKAPLFSGYSIYADGKLLRLFYEPLSPFVLIQASIQGKPKFLWVNVTEKPPVIEDISDLFVGAPDFVVWDSADNDNLFAFYPPVEGRLRIKDIYRINVKNKAIYPQEDWLLPAGLRRQPLHPMDKFFINDKNDFLIREGRSIKIYRREDADTHKGYTIAKSKPSTNMYFEDKNGELFYLEDTTGILCAVQVLPYRPILNIPVPEGKGES